MKRSIESDSSTSSKRRRAQLTPYQKMKICVYKRDHPSASQADITSYFAQHYDLTIGRSTISDILKEKEKWLAHEEEGSSIRSRTAKNQQLDDALQMWMAKMEESHVTVSDLMLIEKAKWFAKQPGIPVPPDFKFSKGWLMRFKKRNGIGLYKREGESASADLTVVTEGRRQLQETLAEWDPDCVYNMDETGLFFRLEPDSTLAIGLVRGKKKSKERLTVALCANSTGTHKLKPLIIGKSKKPRCFGSFNPSVYATYTFNKKAWMTGVLFEEWVTDFNRQMKLAKKKVLLLLDNASSHGKQPKLSNVTIHFLPPNTTSHIQPMDAGIIRTFKAYYSRHRDRHYVRQADAGEKPCISVKDAIIYTHDAWRSVTAATIANCWRHTGIQGPAENASPVEDDEFQSVLSDINDMTAQLPFEHPMTAREQIEADATLPTEEVCTDEDIIAMVTNEADSNTDSEDNDDEPPPPPPTSRKECDAALQTVIKFSGENPLFGEKHVASALSMLSDIAANLHNSKKQSTLTQFFHSDK